MVEKLVAGQMWGRQLALEFQPHDKPEPLPSDNYPPQDIPHRTFDRFWIHHCIDNLPQHLRKSLYQLFV